MKGIQQWPTDSSQNPLTQNVFPCRIFMFPWLYCYLHEIHHGNHLRLNYIFISFTNAYLMPFVVSHNLHFNKGGIVYPILHSRKPINTINPLANITTLKYIVLENASWRLYHMYMYTNIITFKNNTSQTETESRGGAVLSWNVVYHTPAVQSEAWKSMHKANKAQGHLESMS